MYDVRQVEMLRGSHSHTALKPSEVLMPSGLHGENRLGPPVGYVHVYVHVLPNLVYFVLYKMGNTNYLVPKFT